MVHQEGLFEEETTKLKLRQRGMDTCYVKSIPGLKEQWGPILWSKNEPGKFKE